MNCAAVNYNDATMTISMIIITMIIKKYEYLNDDGDKDDGDDNVGCVI